MRQSTEHVLFLFCVSVRERNLLCRRSPGSDDNWDGRNPTVLRGRTSLLFSPHHLTIRLFSEYSRFGELSYLVLGSMAVGNVLLSSVRPNVVPRHPSSPQPVTEGSWHRTSREGMYLRSNAHVNYF